jgi:hypothetical protein
MQFPYYRNATYILTPILFFLFFAACRQTGNNADKITVKDTLKTAKTNEYAAIDQSPLDISYCPADFPQQKMNDPSSTALPVARVIYSRPHKKGRVIFGEEAKSICPYGKPWRLGANESTEIEFFKPVVINGKNVSAGRYVLYCIPYADRWVIVFNDNLNSWGLNIDSSKDVFKTEVPVQKQSPVLEDFTMYFMETSTGADLLMAWDNVKTLLPITYSK